MRLRQLSLDRFGHFTGHALDFGDAGERPDFHIIYGPNEAGKTTTMEAALRLFYGFPHREPYAFKHQRANLSVSGVLEIDGETRGFTRLPKRSGALLDASGTVLPEAALAAHLGGLGEEDYRNLLCLDDDTIERGGEEIAQARGDIGRLLFSAAAGVADLTTVLDGVREEADAIWAKRKTKTHVAELKRELKDIEKEIRERDVTTSAWRGLKKALTDAQAAEATARAARDALHTRAADLAAHRRALPLLAELDALDARLAPFADYPERLEFDPETLVTLKTDQTRAHADTERLRTEIEDLAARQEALVLTPGLATLADDLDQLEDLRARDRANALDLPRRRDQLATAEAAMARAARDLGVADECDPQSLVPTPAQLAALEAARDRLRSARTAAQAEARELADATDRRDRAAEELNRLSAQTSPEADIGAILARYEADTLMPAHATAQQAITAAEQSARASREALATGAVRFESLPDCPMSRIRAHELAEAYEALHRKIDAESTALAQHQEDIAARQAQIDQLSRDGQLVPDDAAAALRTARDRQWQAHLAAMTPATAQDFAAAMQALDGAQEARITHARDLGQLRQIAQARAEAQARADQARARMVEYKAAQAAIEAEVDAAAKAAGLPGPLVPAEWLDWVDRHAAAQAAARAANEAQDMHGATLARAQALLDALRPQLDLVFPDVASAVAAARRLAESELQARRAMETAREALRLAEADLSARARKHDASQQEADKAAQAWHDLVLESLGQAVSPDTLLAALDPLRSLATQQEKRAEAAQRVATMERDQALFAEKVAALATAHDQPQADTPADSFELLRAASGAARAAQEQADDLGVRIATARAALDEANRRLTEIADTVTTLGRAFPSSASVDTLDALRATAHRAAEIIKDRENLSALTRRIMSELGVSDLVTARARLDEASLVSLDAEAESCKADLDRAEQALTDATEARVTSQQALSQVTGDADIATLTERRATLELELQEAAQAHLELSLGHRLAEVAIRRYRDTHRSGMMAATERCFAALTQGAYTHLTTQPDGAGETLLAVDEEGTAKRVAEMSKGTRFQLYLALRAAAHQQLVAQGTCLPFFCDDIFETFDEDRTSAACRVMERIGQSGQAIYLTHHRHVVEIAQKVCDTPPIVHEI
ncbi:AAA family ATPase [Lutimaribacter sp. EGI FJ00015]|uniref:AAA family ATPase n=1 Tax=Lutimaribacter degradans TaxID=2945989 RepID=A0ACC5ZW09_9RHOB|nr:YhaN family protein [Lutimaribacter sp. EGI FJ00013]MCM2562257.1 AAA family ATPase [Lutimaribacter sp. EGI FJ00013]MCO0613412.1 AAA family ATPase [Lutimaribacter sp. EGI FJ00015]MCO0636386.1 AAA family ATPase [Lutimaribacter sp. EGI FJ00014]